MIAGKRRAQWCGGILAVLLAAWPAMAADETGIESLATCRESWLDWQTANDPRLAVLAGRLRADFTQTQGDAFVVPKAEVSLAGFRVLQVYPDSVGMGVGFSVLIAAPFDDAKKVFEKTLGKTLVHCETSDGMRSCERTLGDKRTFMLMSSDTPGDTKTLIGCYYYYEK